MLDRALVASVFAGATLFASPALAQTAPPPPGQPQPVAIETPPVGAAHGGDTLVLKDGTTLHGTIREMTPGQAVTIVLPDGKVRTVEWSAVDRVDIDRARAPAPPAPAQTTTAVHLEGAGPGIVLQALDERGTEGKWQTVCEGACDRDLPTGGLYRVDGPGLRTSRPFRLPEGSRVDYQVHAASSLGFAGGLTLVIVGGVALLTGLTLLVELAVYDANGYIIPDGFLVAGGLLTGGGLAAFIPGIFLMKGNGRTTVTAAGGGATARVPAWREPQLPSWQPRWATIGVPVWSGTF
ncbi:MAG TPA: hypothetical protein VLM85_16185 [Polyangiaceae bacterium]|nr:hypothetical protein [Polyangiaceae bacterium]